MRKPFLTGIRSVVLGGLVLTWAVLVPALAEDATRAAAASDLATPEDVFKAKGLSKVGLILVIAQETEVHSAANSVRALKSTVTTETLARANMSRAIDTATDIVNKLDSELASMDEQMNRVKRNASEYNKLVEPYNATLKQLKLRKAALAELRKKLGKIEDSQGLFNDTAIATVKKADATTAAYAELARDGTLKASIDRYNKGADRPVQLGPSSVFAIDVAFVKKCVADMIAEGIPARMDHGVPVVEVIINGKKHEMIWDSGASLVSLSAQTAAELDLHVTDKDPTVISTVADGRKVESKLIIVPLIRVGPFAAENVECLVDPPSSVRGPDLLGGSFQRHFFCRLDQQAGVLHLTPIDKSASTTRPSVAVIPSVPSGPPIAPPDTKVPPATDHGGAGATAAPHPAPPRGPAPGPAVASAPPHPALPQGPAPGLGAAPGPPRPADGPASWLHVTLIVVNDDTRCDVEVFRNGSQIKNEMERHDGHRSGHWRRAFHFNVAPSDTVVFKTTDKDNGAVLFLLVDDRGNLLNYSRLGTPISGEADGLNDFYGGKGGIAAVPVPDKKKSKVDDSLGDPHTPRQLPPDCEAIWLPNLKSSPIYVRVYPAVANKK